MPDGSVPVDASARGWTRSLFSRIALADAAFAKAARALLAPAVDRLQRYPGRPLRSGMLVELEHGWHALPNLYRLHCAVTVQKDRLAADDHTLSPGKLLCTDWGEHEDTITLMHGELRVGRGLLRYSERATVLIGVHACSRWYQRRRACGPSEDALLNDLGRLIGHTADDIPAGAGFAVRTECGGSWRGRSLRTQTTHGRMQLLAVRTWTSGG